MDGKLLNAVDVAAVLRVGQRTLWRWRDSGRLPAPVKIGGCVRWRASDIEQWVAAACPDCRRTGWTVPPAAGCAGKCGGSCNG